MQNQIDITILCKVVDNFGDIGVVYRLAKALTELCNNPINNFPKIKLRIVVDNLHSFSLLEPKIDEKKSIQEINEWKVLQWNDNEICLSEFQKNPPKIIIECFQCGRPDWLDHLLFDIKVPNIVNIVMLDYLTAEDYAETFHCLKSLTRSARVQKVNFMPGFTTKTGGLIQDENFINFKPIEKNLDNNFNAVFFSYTKDWMPVVKALNTFNKEITKNTLQILAAKGVGLSSFLQACKEANFTVKELDFLPQKEWDNLLYNSPLLFIRGEDSLSRACLSGKPFIWHAYPQSEDYQLVKVQALLEKLKPFFYSDHFKIIEKCWLTYNGKKGNLEQDLTEFLLIYKEIFIGFQKFSENLKKNGDLAKHLMTFILKTINIE